MPSARKWLRSTLGGRGPNFRAHGRSPAVFSIDNEDPAKPRPRAAIRDVALMDITHLSADDCPCAAGSDRLHWRDAPCLVCSDQAHRKELTLTMSRAFFPLALGAITLGL